MFSSSFVAVCTCMCQVKLLSNETKVHCQAHLRTIEALKASKKFCQQIQTQLQHKEQEVKDLTAVKDYRYAPVLVYVSVSACD